jgi:hypothetical protein
MAEDTNLIAPGKTRHIFRRHRAIIYGNIIIGEIMLVSPFRNFLPRAFGMVDTEENEEQYDNGSNSHIILKFAP